MLSNRFVRLLTSLRPVQNYQQHFLRLLSTTESMATENHSTERQTGTVKRFSKDKGYGFISNNSDGTDCFVHFKNINTTGFKTLEQGQEVEFSLVQGEKGLEARDVNILSAGTGQSSFMGGGSYNNSTSSRFGGGFGGGGYGGDGGSFGGGGGFGKQSSSAFGFGGMRSSENQDFRSSNDFFPARQMSNNQGREIGSVKRWTNGRGFGFIRRANGGPDLFCHVRSLRDGVQELEEGQTVEYRIQRTDKGEEARDVSIYNEDAERQDSPSYADSNERQTGTVRRWLPEKGYGFLRQSSGGTDVFVHLRDLNDGLMSLEEGQTVEFDIKTNEKGPTAQNVTVLVET